MNEKNNNLYGKTWGNSCGSLLKISLENDTSFWFLACRLESPEKKMNTASLDVRFQA